MSLVSTSKIVLKETLLQAALGGFPKRTSLRAWGRVSPGISPSSRIAAGRGHTGEQWVSCMGILSTSLRQAACGVPAPTWPP